MKLPKRAIYVIAGWGLAIGAALSIYGWDH
jgi:hypothetical protein